MKFSDKLSLAWKDVTNRKGRSLLTIFSISIGVILLIVLLGIGDGVVNKVKDLVASFGNTKAVLVMPKNASDNPLEGIVDTNTTTTDSGALEEVNDSNRFEKKDSDFKKIDEESIKKLSQMDDVDYVTAAIKSFANSIKLEDGSKETKSRYTMYGYNGNYKCDYKDDISVGSDISDKANDVIISKDIARNLGYSNYEDALNKNITIVLDLGVTGVNPFELSGTIKGVIEKNTYAQTVIMSDEKILPLVNFANGTKNYIDEKGYDAVNAYPKEGVKTSTLSKSIQDDLGYATFSMESMNIIFDSLGVIIKGILSIGGIIVMIVSACGLINTISMILQEKKKMIGVMRSVGGAKFQIRSIFRYQSIILGLIGAVAGGIFSFLGILITNNLIISDSGFKIALTPNNVLIAVGITFVISLLASTFPARKASNLNVVEAVAEE